MQLARSRVKRSIRDPGSLCQPAVKASIIRTHFLLSVAAIVHLSLSLKETEYRCIPRARKGRQALCERRTVGNSRPFSRGARKRRQWIRGRSIANPNPGWSHILRSLPLSLLGWRTLSPPLSLYSSDRCGASPTLSRPGFFLFLSTASHSASSDISLYLLPPRVPPHDYEIRGISRMLALAS